MKTWVTELYALDHNTGDFKKWVGDNIKAPTWQLAQQWCDNNKGYLKVIGELIAEIPCKEGTIEPNWDEMTDYEIIQNN